ncbi:acyltransferase, partial [Lacrimispora amygdalina]
MQKEKYLDGIRGVAAFIVVIYHYISAFYPALYYGSINNVRTGSGVELIIASTPLNLLYDGDVSVCIFFILSGYVLTYKFFKYNDTSAIISTGIRRYFRLMPPVLFSVFIAYILMKLQLFYNVKASEITTSFWLGSFYNFSPNILEMFKHGVWGVLFRQSVIYNPTLWTMYYEFYGSLIVLSFVLLIGKSRNRHIFYIVALFITIHTKFLPFIFGLILSDLYNTKQ